MEKEERGGVGEKRKGKGRGGGVVAEKKERNLCPTPIASFYSPPPPLHKFSSLWLSPRIVDCAFLFLFSWRFPPFFSRCFLFLPRFSPMRVDLLPLFLICCEERRRGRTSQLTAFPQLFSLLFLQMATGRNLHLKEKGGRGGGAHYGRGGTELSRRGFFFWRAVRRGG